MAARRSLLFVVVGVLFAAGAVIQPGPGKAHPGQGRSNYRLMDAGRPVQS